MTPNIVKAVLATGGTRNGGNGGIELTEAGINDVLRKSDEYSGGWKVKDFNANEVLLSRKDAGADGEHFLSLSRVDIERLYQAQQPKTMKIKG